MSFGCAGEKDWKKENYLKERLQKVLSHAGICSRRKAEELIAAGQVRVNGKVIRELGSEADPVSDRIESPENASA